MRLLSPFRRCARCHHMWEAHQLLNGPDGQPLDGCGAIATDSEGNWVVIGGVLMTCECPVYVQPVSLWVRIKRAIATALNGALR
jgi:hypothetical protein